MDRHPFDPVSLVLGLVLAIAGTIAVSGGSIVEDGRWLLPVGLIGLGLALVVQARASGKRD
ncbi:MAG: hypothetical protein ACRD2C_17325 [Acidimicrobiales bacterium]